MFEDVISRSLYLLAFMLLSTTGKAADPELPLCLLRPRSFPQPVCPDFPALQALLFVVAPKI